MIKLVIGALAVGLGIALIADWAVIVSGFGQRGAVVLAVGSLVEVPAVLLVVLAVSWAVHGGGTGRRSH